MLSAGLNVYNFPPNLFLVIAIYSPDFVSISSCLDSKYIIVNVLKSSMKHEGNKISFSSNSRSLYRAAYVSTYQFQEHFLSYAGFVSGTVHWSILLNVAFTCCVVIIIFHVNKQEFITAVVRLAA